MTTKELEMLDSSVKNLLEKITDLIDSYRKALNGTWNKCAECGELTQSGIGLQTGRVLIDGRDVGQWVDLCEKHWPATPGGQPSNCEHVEFIWGGKKYIESSLTVKGDENYG